MRTSIFIPMTRPIGHREEGVTAWIDLAMDHLDVRQVVGMDHGGTIRARPPVAHPGKRAGVLCVPVAAAMHVAKNG
jgi:hypothetical protein